MSSSSAYTLLGLTAIVAALVGILAFAMMKFMAAARDARGAGASGGDRTAAVADALATAVSHAHADQALATEARAATAFRLGVDARVRAIQEAISPGPGDPDGHRRLGEAVASLRDLVLRHEPPAGPVDLKTVIDAAVSGYRITARARGGDVVVQGQFATVVARTDSLDFVLSALVSAALDACQMAGMAPVVVVRGSVDTVTRRVRVSVDDNGPGDAPLPDPDVIHSVIEGAGGRVDVAASPMGGAQICLDLPIAAGAPTT